MVHGIQLEINHVLMLFVSVKVLMMVFHGVVLMETRMKMDIGHVARKRIKM